MLGTTAGGQGGARGARGPRQLSASVLTVDDESEENWWALCQATVAGTSDLDIFFHRSLQNGKKTCCLGARLPRTSQISSH